MEIKRNDIFVEDLNLVTGNYWDDNEVILKELLKYSQRNKTKKKKTR